MWQNSGTRCVASVYEQVGGALVARIRTIKPEFWDSPGVETLDFQWRLLFVAMWNWADDSGRGKAEARELMGFAFPRDEDMTVGEFRRGLGEVRRVFGVVFYKVDGRSFYFIPSWVKHQKIDKRSAPRWPGPEEGQEYDPATNQPVDQQESESRRDSAETPPRTRREEGAGTGEQGNRGTGEEGNEEADASSSSETAPPTRPEIVKLCQHLADRMIGNGCKPPTVGKKWLDEARLLLDTDKRDFDDAMALIDWCQDHHFWRSNIKSMTKFRAQYDTLRLQRDDRKGSNYQPYRDPNPADYHGDL